jgi:hypothetical protein
MRPRDSSHIEAGASRARDKRLLSGVEDVFVPGASVGEPCVYVSCVSGTARADGRLSIAAYREMRQHSPAVRQYCNNIAPLEQVQILFIRFMLKSIQCAGKYV